MKATLLAAAMGPQILIEPEDRVEEEALRLLGDSPRDLVAWGMGDRKVLRGLIIELAGNPPEAHG